MVAHILKSFTLVIIEYWAILTTSLYTLVTLSIKIRKKKFTATNKEEKNENLLLNYES
jgi:hypothetical protein